MSHKKHLITFHHTGWLLGILVMAYYHGPHINWVVYSPIYTNKKQVCLSIAQVWKKHDMATKLLLKHMFCGEGGHFSIKLFRAGGCFSWAAGLLGGRYQELPSWHQERKGMWLYQPTLRKRLRQRSNSATPHFNKLVATRFTGKKTSNYIEIYLEPKWPLFWLDKDLVLEGSTPKIGTNRFQV